MRCNTEDVLHPTFCNTSDKYDLQCLPIQTVCNAQSDASYIIRCRPMWIANANLSGFDRHKNSRPFITVEKRKVI